MYTSNLIRTPNPRHSRIWNRSKPSTKSHFPDDTSITTSIKGLYWRSRRNFCNHINSLECMSYCFVPCLSTTCNCTILSINLVTWKSKNRQWRYLCCLMQNIYLGWLWNRQWWHWCYFMNDNFYVNFEFTPLEIDKLYVQFNVIQ